MKTSPLLSLIAAGAVLVLAGCETTPPPAPPPAYLPTPADVVALSKAGVADEVIISQIRNSRVVYRLTAAQIIELKDKGVSPKVLDFMINTPQLFSR